METFSVLVTFCEGNPSVTGWFPPQRSVTQSFDVFFDLRLNKRLSKQSGRFETPSRSLWRHRNIKEKKTILADNSQDTNYVKFQTIFVINYTFK